MSSALRTPYHRTSKQTFWFGASARRVQSMQHSPHPSTFPKSHSGATFASMALLALLMVACGSETDPLGNRDISSQIKQLETNPGGVKPRLANPSDWTEEAPESFSVQFNTDAGYFIVDVNRADAPIGADRFFNLVRSGYLNDTAYFRVVPDFVVQFGINGAPEVSIPWFYAFIPAEDFGGAAPPLSNTAGTIAFATFGTAESRNTQLYINTVDNEFLDDYDQYIPFGKVRTLDVVRDISAVHGEEPSQVSIYNEGNDYLDTNFPSLDYNNLVHLLKQPKNHK